MSCEFTKADLGFTSISRYQVAYQILIIPGVWLALYLLFKILKQLNVRFFRSKVLDMIKDISRVCQFIILLFITLNEDEIHFECYDPTDIRCLRPEFKSVKISAIVYYNILLVVGILYTLKNEIMILSSQTNYNVWFQLLGLILMFGLNIFNLTILAISPFDCRPKRSIILMTQLIMYMEVVMLFMSSNQANRLIHIGPESVNL
jgi:hypothetical protein